MRALLHGVSGVDETRRSQLCLWPVAAPDDNLHHHAVAGDHEDTIARLYVRSETVIWSPEQPNREPDVERAATAEELLMEIPYEYLGPDSRTLVNPRDQRSDGIGI